MYKIFGAMSSDWYSEICVHFGIDSVENLVANRRNRFIKRYGETDNYLCQMLRWSVSLVSLYFYCICLISVCCIYSCILSYHVRWWNKAVYNSENSGLKSHMLLRYYVCYYGPVLRYVCQKLQLQLRSDDLQCYSNNIPSVGLCKISVWPQACKQSVFQRNHSEKKTFIRVLPTR